MANRYKVTLTQAGRDALGALTRKGKPNAAKFIHARALLLCDAGEHGQPWKVADVAIALGVTPRTIELIKRRFVQEGIEAALGRKPSRQPREVVFRGGFEARLTKLAFSKAPQGRARWTIRLLAEKLVDLKIVKLHPQTRQLAQLLRKLNVRSTASASTDGQYEMRREFAAWQNDRNNRGAPINWHFSFNDVLIKLTHIYPKL